MQVSVETVAGLERRMRVEVPEDKVQGEVSKRLGDLAQNVRIPGFRPGKAPVKVIAQRYGKQVRDEVVGELVQSSFFEALTQENLKPASTPTIEPVESGPGAGVAYTATFDVLPDVTLPPFEEIKIARPVAEVTAENVDSMIETLRVQRKTWNPVERAATPADRVVIDFEGTLEGAPLEGGSATEFPLELEGGRMIEGFEDGLVGSQAGDERTLDLSFPDAYHAEHLAGKPVSFQIKVHRVEESALPDADDEFAKSFGVEDGGIETLRSEVRANMERELAEALTQSLKQRVMDAVLAGNDLEVPNSMVEEEVERALTRRSEELRQSGLDPDSVALDREMFVDPARRRVTLGLLIAEIIKTHEIQANPERVRKRIETIASTYQEPSEVINFYYSDRERLSEIESMVLEDQVVEWIVERADVGEDPSSFDALLNPGQTS